MAASAGIEAIEYEAHVRRRGVVVANRTQHTDRPDRPDRVPRERPLSLASRSPKVEGKQWRRTQCALMRTWSSYFCAIQASVARLAYTPTLDERARLGR